MFNSVNPDYKLDREQLTGIVNIQSFISANGEATNCQQRGSNIKIRHEQPQDTT